MDIPSEYHCVLLRANSACVCFVCYRFSYVLTTNGSVRNVFVLLQEVQMMRYLYCLNVIAVREEQLFFSYSKVARLLTEYETNMI